MLHACPIKAFTLIKIIKIIGLYNNAYNLKTP